MPPKRQPRRQTRSSAAARISSNQGSAAQPTAEDNGTSAVAPPDVAAENLHVEEPVTGYGGQPEQLKESEGVALDEAVADDSMLPAPATDEHPDFKPQATQSNTRRPVQRLASLRNPTGVNPRSASQSLPGERPGPLKFKPKSVQRRSKEERDAAAVAEAEREARRAGTIISEAGGRGGSVPRGRGRGLIRGGTERLTGAGASGHLGGGNNADGTRQPTRGRSLFGSGGGSGGGGRAGTGANIRGHGRGGRGGAMNPGNQAIQGIHTSRSVVKSETDRDGNATMGSTTSKKKVKKEPGLAYGISSSESEQDGKKAKRINIEEINLVSSEDDADDEGASKGKERAKTLKPRNPRPVRFFREEHVERAVGVNTDPTTLKSAELRKKVKERKDASTRELSTIPLAKKSRGKTKDVEFIKDERKWQGVYQDEDDSDSVPRVKEEPKDDGPMIIDEDYAPPTAQLAGEVPSINVQEAEREIGSVSGDVEMTNLPSSPFMPSGATSPPFRHSSQDEASPVLKPKRFRRKYRPPKPVLQTDEDHQEWARYKDDITWMHDTLLEAGGAIKAEPKATDHDGDIEMDHPTIGPSIHDNSIFLFQFPPVLPILIDARTKKEEDHIKPEKKEQEETTSIPPHTQASSSITTEIPTPANPSKKPPPKAKPKAPPPKDPTPEPPAPPPAPQVYTPLSAPLPQGRFGTFRLHRSKRVTANWGTLQFEIGRSSERKVAQEVVACGWSKVVVKKEGFEGADDGTRIKGEDMGEERGEWREEVGCGEKVWALGGVQGGWVGVPDLGAMFGV